ncbi:uncharacterized protein LACBIDRAFT_332154 [Laccaria bicolor S238N-H82]|uniref:Predicted protein n=1 Tax=Laccaria bicolor (strain S238N-H82 / ATCC MYA-4686) TaxID=486041 RepID=B0DRS3_LACBS|nr:uncharacterized protein LACBIDRAFT_332154 [Laccaria bicolor S238N-H82]EDR02580.1 predicted protein [Laccaria bicolor S238N-H82]|eukprot:XP_001886624.1 predicted protein [Laccaria bicolor S238N-H82]
MTHASWADKDQNNWLDSHKAQFIEVNQWKAATKEFFPDMVKDFCEKWPVSPATPEEVEKASSEESATKKKHKKYDKRVRNWFHNNTRNMASNRGTHGILKVKAKPKMLQAWQAYHALTYHFSHPFLGTYEVIQFFELGNLSGTPFQSGCNTDPLGSIFCGLVLQISSDILSYKWRL